MCPLADARGSVLSGFSGFVQAVDDVGGGGIEVFGGGGFGGFDGAPDDVAGVTIDQEDGAFAAGERAHGGAAEGGGGRAFRGFGVGGGGELVGEQQVGGVGFGDYGERGILGEADGEVLIEAAGHGLDEDRFGVGERGLREGGGGKQSGQQERLHSFIILW